MKSLLDEIRQQPEHIRHIFMWTCVVIVFSVIGFVWFRSTTKQFVALLHPEEAQERALAEKEKTLRQAQGRQPSPFATLFNSFGSLKADISELIGGSDRKVNVNGGSAGSGVPEKDVPPQKLPVTE